MPLYLGSLSTASHLLVCLFGGPFILFRFYRRGMLWLGCTLLTVLLGFAPLNPDVQTIQLVLVVLLSLTGLVAAARLTFPRKGTTVSLDLEKPLFGPRRGYSRWRRWSTGVFRSLLWTTLTVVLLLGILLAHFDPFGGRHLQFVVRARDGSTAIYVYENSIFFEPIVWPEITERWGLFQIEWGSSWPAMYASDLFYNGKPVQIGAHRVHFGLVAGVPRASIDGAEGDVYDVRPLRGASKAAW